MFGMYIIPTDFIVLEYNAYYKVPIILGCPFFDTSVAFIDVREGTLNIILNDEGVVFKVYNVLKTPSHYRDICVITIIKVYKCGVE